MKYLKKLLLVMLITSFIGTSALGIYVWINKDKIFTSEVDEAFILGNIFENNPQALLSRSSTVASGGRDLAKNALSLESTEEDASDVGYLEEYKAYNYNHITTITTPGAKASSCKSLYIPEDEETNESYDYFDSENYYYKWIRYNENDEVVNYGLNFGENNYQYQGGDYAINFINEVRDVVATETVEDTVADSAEEVVTEAGEEVSESSEVVEDTADSVTSSDVATDYFGEDATVEIINEDGVNYYVMTWSYEMNCDESYDLLYSSRSSTTLESSDESSSDTTTIYVRSWADETTYEIFKQELYLDSIADENLISTTTTEIDARDVEYSEVASEFEFDIDVPVREIETDYSYVDYYSDIDGYMNQMTEFLSTKNVTAILTSDESDLNLSNANATIYYDKMNDWYSYSIDRDFYSDDEDGQEAYESAVESYWLKPGSQTLLYTDFSNDDYTKNIYVSTFEGTISDSDIWSNYVYLSEDMTSITKDVLIDGTTISANGYEWSYDSIDYDTSSSSGEEAVEEEIKLSYSQFYVLVSYNGFKYLINYSSQNEESDDVVLPKFDSYDLTNSSELSSFKSKVQTGLESIINRQNVSEGSSGEGSAPSEGEE